MSIVVDYLQKVRKQPALVWWALICLVYVLFCANYVIGDYQNHNGDFGQYYIHSQNLLSGRSWSDLLDRYPAVLPGYPILLALVTSLFGDTYFVIGLTNTVLWALTCLVATSLVYNVFSDKAFGKNTNAILVLTTLLASSYIFAFQQDGQPNIFYGFAFVLAIWAVRRETLPFWALCIILLLPAFIRIDSAVLYTATGIYAVAQKNRRLVLLSMGGFLLTLSLDFAITYLFGMKSNIWHFLDTSARAGVGTGLWQFVQIYSDTVLAILLRLPELFISAGYELSQSLVISGQEGLNAKTSLIGGVFIVLFLIGFFSPQPVYQAPHQVDGLFSYERLVIAGHIAFTGLFFVDVIALRYLIPIMPFFVIFLIIGISKVNAFFQLPKLVPITICALCIYSLGNTARTNEYEIAKRKNFMTSASTLEMADHIAETLGDRPVGFYKPRLLTVLLLQRDAAVHTTRGGRALSQLEPLFADNGVLVTINHFTRQDVKDWLAQNEELCETWTNKTFSIYEVRPDGGSCPTRIDM